MAKQKFINNFDWQFIGPVVASTHVGYESTIGKGILQISDAAGALLTNPTGGDWYVLTAFKRSGSVESAIEVLKVLGVNEVSYAAPGECRIRVERGHESTTSQTYVAGDLISMRITAGGLNDLASDEELAIHTSNISNPHSVTKVQVGLGNVDNTSDANKPVSTAQQTALDAKQSTSGKDSSGGYAGLTLFKLNLRNAANSITSWFTTAATAARTWTLPDKDGTVAMTSDITGTNSGTNTGDETTATIKTKLGITTLSGSNTGDQDLSGKQDVLVSGANIKTINGQALPGFGNVVIGGGLTRVEVAGTTQTATSGNDYWAENVAATALTAPAPADGVKFAFTPANGLTGPNANTIDFGAATVRGPFGTVTGILTLDLGLPMEFEYSSTLGKWVSK